MRAGLSLLSQAKGTDVVSDFAVKPSRSSLDTRPPAGLWRFAIARLPSSSLPRFEEARPTHGKVDLGGQRRCSRFIREHVLRGAASPPYLRPTLLADTALGL